MHIKNKHNNQKKKITKLSPREVPSGVVIMLHVCGVTTIILLDREWHGRKG